MYNKSVIVERTCSIHDPIKKTSLPLFRSPTRKTKSKQAGQISMLKSDVQLFSRLYIVMRHREGDMNTFFKHENHPYPPSLSEPSEIHLHFVMAGHLSVLLNPVLAVRASTWSIFYPAQWEAFPLSGTTRSVM